MPAGSARNGFRRFKHLYLYQTPFKYTNTSILNLNTDIVQCAKDDEFIRSILVASSRFSFLKPLLVHVNYEALSLLFYLLVSLIALFSVDYITISQLDNSNFFFIR